MITHPHPAYGGSMHTPVPAALFRRCHDRGWAALRFNFRGVGRSTGVHDAGDAEQIDVAAALAALRSALDGAGSGDAVPLILAGWSFGADVALAVTDDVAGWVAVAAPLAVVPVADMGAAAATPPKLLLVPEHDQFRTPADAQALTEAWVSTEVAVLAGTDHFLGGRLDHAADAFERFVDAAVASRRAPSVPQPREHPRP